MDEPTLQDQIILARSKLWTPELDKLLRKWKRQVELRRRGHSSIERKWSKRHYIFGVPATVLTAITSTGILATFRNCNDCDDPDQSRCEADQYIRLAIGIVGIFEIALTGIMTFMNYQESANAHKEAADNYESLYGNIDSLLIIPPSVRGDPITTLHDIRQKYDDNVRKSPNLPGKYQEYKELSYSVLNKDHSNNFIQTIPKPNMKEININNNKGGYRTDILKSVISDLSTNEEDDNTSSTNKIERHVLTSKKSKDSSDNEYFDALLEEHNNFNSDDEDKEVCLAYDIDRMISMTDNHSPIVAAIKGRRLSRAVSNECSGIIRRNSLKSHKSSSSNDSNDINIESFANDIKPCMIKRKAATSISIEE